MDPPFLIVPALAEELPAAFRLVFQQLDEPEREARVANALELVERGELQSAGIFVARAASRLLGAMVCLPVPGASGLVWPPQAIPGAGQREVEDQLVRRVTAWLQERGAKLAQALLNPAEAEQAASLARNGFPHVTSLWYLRHSLDLSLELLAESDCLDYRSYAAGDPDVFHRTLLRTYEGTRDCPEVNGVRTLDEVLEGHRAQGVYDPERWWLALEADEPVGVLILSEVREWSGWDVSYVGVMPEARGRGLGRELMRKALFEARAAEVAQLTLTVDARNTPACNLYRRLGFESFDQREVYLAIWSAARGG